MSRKAKILIVDDEVILAASVERELARRGYQTCESACSGEEALETLKTEQPDLVLLDCCLSGCDIDGFETAMRIRSTSNVPIVFMSGLSRAEIGAKFDAIQGSAFLPKPFDPEALVQVIENALATGTSPSP